MRGVLFAVDDEDAEDTTPRCVFTCCKLCKFREGTIVLFEREGEVRGKEEAGKERRGEW